MKTSVSITFACVFVVAAAAPSAHAGSYERDKQGKYRVAPLDADTAAALKLARKVQKPTRAQRLRRPYRLWLKPGAQLRLAPDAKAKVAVAIGERRRPGSARATIKGWLLVRHKQWRGWVKAQSAVRRPRGFGWRAVAEQQKLHRFDEAVPAKLRRDAPLLRGARKRARVVKKLAKGTAVKLTGVRGRFVAVRAGNAAGYVERAAVRPDASSPPAWLTKRAARDRDEKRQRARATSGAGKRASR